VNSDRGGITWQLGKSYQIGNEEIESIKDYCNRINGLVNLIDHDGFKAEIKGMLKGITDTVETVKKGG
jgi:hypothetical protein